MAQKKRTKKITQNDIKKNSSIQLGHSIRKIKENERKYTVILVTFFIVLFCFIGYSTLTISSEALLSNINSKKIYTGVYSSGRTVTMTNENVMSDEEGLKSEIYTFSIKNDTSSDYYYKLVLSEDKSTKTSCECNNNLNEAHIKYSLDGINVLTFDSDEEMIITKDMIKEETDDNITIRLWLSETTNDDEDYHIHAKIMLVEE